MSEMSLDLDPKEGRRNGRRLTRGIPGKRSHRTCDSGAGMEMLGVREMEKEV